MPELGENPKLNLPDSLGSDAEPLGNFFTRQGSDATEAKPEAQDVALPLRRLVPLALGWTLETSRGW
jgi:hypothetical protein